MLFWLAWACSVGAVLTGGPYLFGRLLIELFADPHPIIFKIGNALSWMGTIGGALALAAALFWLAVLYPG